MAKAYITSGEGYISNMHAHLHESDAGNLGKAAQLRLPEQADVAPVQQ